MERKEGRKEKSAILTQQRYKYKATHITLFLHFRFIIKPLLTCFPMAPLVSFPLPSPLPLLIKILGQGLESSQSLLLTSSFLQARLFLLIWVSISLQIIQLFLLHSGSFLGWLYFLHVVKVYPLLQTYCYHTWAGSESFFKQNISIIETLSPLHILIKSSSFPDLFAWLSEMLIISPFLVSLLKAGYLKIITYLSNHFLSQSLRK